MSSRPASVPGWYWPRPKKMCSPVVKARAARRCDSTAASSSVCSRTAEKSAPKRGSMKRRSGAASGVPPDLRAWMRAPVSPAACGAPVPARCTRSTLRATVGPAVATRAGAGICTTRRATSLASRSAASCGEDRLNAAR